MPPPWGLCLKAAGWLIEGALNRLLQDRVATARTESPRTVSCHKKPMTSGSLFHAAERRGIWLRTVVKVPAALSSPRVLRPLHSYGKFPPLLNPWLRTLQMGPGSVVLHGTVAVGWRFPMCPHQQKPKRRNNWPLGISS